MTYAVKEVFASLQGEGANTGRAAVFCRFSRCNLWTGREEDRASALCQFCDTDFVGTDGPGGGLFQDASKLATHIAAFWRGGSGVGPLDRLVICTGGEPLLQLDDDLIDALHELEMSVAIETNGTLPIPNGVDWVCVSPKARTPLVVTRGDELKLVFPQDDGSPERYEDLDFDHFFLAPMDGPDLARATELAVEYCMEHPRWRLSLQTHKYIGIK